jgi:hypothetical protein
MDNFWVTGSSENICRRARKRYPTLFDIGFNGLNLLWGWKPRGLS